MDIEVNPYPDKDQYGSKKVHQFLEC